MMNHYIKRLYLMSWVLFTIQMSGQVSLEASINKSKVPLNGSFSITFSLETDNSNASNSKINYPDLGDFDQIGTSTGYQMDMHTVIKSITYILRPKEEGTFQIEKASVTIDGKNYETQPLTITVTPASLPSQANGNSQSKDNNNPKQGQYIPRSGEILDNDTSPDTKLLITANNLSPYVGQQVLLTLRLLTRDHNVLQNIGLSKQIQFKNFSWERYKIKNSHSQKENYKGRNYYSDIIFQAIISPQKAGKIPLEAFQIQVPYLIKTGERDDFFGDFIERYILTKLNSNTLVFNVKPLPSEGKPVDFSGAVGDFNLTTFLDKKSSNAGESVQLDVEVSGKGDFKMVKIPEINQIDSEALELYDPGTTKKITLTQEGNKGKVSKNYIIVPQYKGEYEIPKLHFSYFNPITQRYETKTTDSKTLHIISGPEKPSKVLTEKNDIEIKEKKAPEQALTNKIFLKPYKEELTIEKLGLSEKVLGLIILSVSLITPLIIILLNILRRRKGAKKKNYRRLIKKYMAQAQKYNNSEEIIPFYMAIEKAVYYNLKQKLKIQKADFDLLKIRITLNSKNVSRENIEKVYKIMQECNYQKYAPSDSKKSMKKIYQETADFIKNFKV